MSDAGPIAQSPVVRTTLGAVRGYEDRGVEVFKGVPYGADTGGAARFRPPRAAEPWTGVRAATAYGDRCPQLGFPGLLAEEAMAVGTEAMSEDCLNLNVWTPGLDDGRRPVMVWFHGGAFAAGSGAGVRNDGVNLCRRRDVVVVTVNHRLNLFGFLHLAEVGGPEFARSGVAGMLDCVLALEWVRDNIARFGGDPGCVTIFGESGGGSKVSTLMAMPAAKGLFHRVIAQSGFALLMSPPEVAAGIARKLMESAGAADAAALQSTPAERLLEALGRLGPPAALALAPVVEGHALPRHPFTPDAPAVSADVPMIVGANETEATFLPFCPLGPIDAAALEAGLAEFTRLPAAEVSRLVAAYRQAHPGKDETYLFQLIASDWWLGYDAAVQAERKAALGAAPAYLYHFARHSPARGGRLRAVHTLEIPYVFDNLHLSEALTGPATKAQQDLADLMSGIWTRFARTGDPNGPGLPAWPPYDAATRAVMVFDAGARVVEDPLPSLRAAIARARARMAP